ncbi:MAG: flagellar basal body-associated FliL family protein [Polyangiaceae bacterium]
MEDDDAKPEEGQEPKKSKKKLLFIIVGVVLLAGVGVGGAFLGPKLMGKDQAQVAPEPAASAQEEAISATATMAPIVVDLRDAEDSIHHMKVVLSFELSEGTTEDDFKKYSPRGRELAIAYLRSQTFEFVTEPKNFPKVSKELTSRATEGIGAKRIQRALITDFVSQ